MAEANLKQKAIKGGFWVFAVRVISRILSFLRLVILARLLVPEDFGLMGIALLSLATLETFSETGFQQALIQKKKNIEEYLNTAWTTQILRGIILFIILFSLASYAVAFFNAPLARPIIQIISLSLLVQAFTNVGIVYFQKELEFNKQFIYELGGTLADFMVAIVAASILRSVWALVFGFLAGSIARLIASYFIHPWRPRLDFDLVKAKELFGFGKWIFGSSILIFLVTQGDDILVGRLLGVVALGFYQMAYKVSNLPATEITHVISQVTFPAYSKLQNNMPKLREAYLNVLRLTTFLSFPIAGLIFALAPDFTKIFLGEKWLPMVPAMQVLALWGLIRAIGATTGPVFHGVGKPRITTIMQLIALVLLIILIYPLSIRFGILGTSLAVVFSTLISTLVASYMVVRVTKWGIWNFCKIVTYPLIGMAIIISSIFILKTYWISSIGTPEFFLFIFLGIFIYFLTVYLSDKFFGYGTRDTIKGLLNSFEG